MTDKAMNHSLNLDCAEEEEEPQPEPRKESASTFMVEQIFRFGIKGQRWQSKLRAWVGFLCFVYLFEWEI